MLEDADPAFERRDAVSLLVYQSPELQTPLYVGLRQDRAPEFGFSVA